MRLSPIRSVIIILTLPVFAVAQNIQWAHHASSFQGDIVESFAVDQNESVVAVGSFESTININGISLTSQDQSDIFIYKATKYGEVIWAHTFGGPVYQGDVGVDLDASGNVYVAGGYVQELYFDNTKKLTGGNFWNSFVAKLNNQGELQWIKGLNAISLADIRVWGVVDVNPDGEVVIAANVDGDVVVDGTVLNTESGSSANSILIIKFNSSGEIIWTKNPPSTTNAQVNAIATDQQDNIYLTGFFTNSITFDSFSLTAGNPTHSDIFLVKYDKNGSVSWADGLIKTTTDGLNNDGRGLAVDPDTNDIFLTGTFKGTIKSGSHQISGVNTSEDPGNADGYIARYSSTGTLTWLKRIGTTSHDILNSIAITQRNTFLVCGGHGLGFSIFLQEFDLDGNVISVRDLPASGIARHIAVVPTGDIYLAGILISDLVESDIHLTSKGWDGFLLRMGNDPLPPEGGIPNVFTPNSDTFNDYFQLPVAYLGSTLSVYNRWGQLVYATRNYQNTWSGNGLSSGVYYYHIQRVCCDPVKGWVQIVH